MRSIRKYKVTIEDESHLSEVGSVHFTIPKLSIAAFSIVVLLFITTGLIIAYTPLRTLLPGYLKESQRSANEEGLLRLDSLMEVYEADRAFLDNYFKVMDINREPSDSAAATASAQSRQFGSDSLITASKAEKEFVSNMEESERFNVSVLTPLAADNLNFGKISGEGIFTKESQASTEGTILLPRDENVQNAADGTVIGLYYSAPERGYVILVQHNHGFVTSFSHLGSPLVAVGDDVRGGQVLSSGPAPDSNGKRWVNVKMWHNGLPIVPYDYLGKSAPVSSKISQKYEEPRGK